MVINFIFKTIKFGYGNVGTLKTLHVKWIVEVYEKLRTQTDTIKYQEWFHHSRNIRGSSVILVNFIIYLLIYFVSLCSKSGSVLRFYHADQLS